jgi:hypothetical protein
VEPFSLLFSVQGPPACPKWESSKFQGVEEIAYGSEWGSFLVLTVEGARGARLSQGKVGGKITPRPQLQFSRQ